MSPRTHTYPFAAAVLAALALTPASASGRPGLPVQRLTSATAPAQTPGTPTTHPLRVKDPAAYRAGRAAAERAYGASNRRRARASATTRPMISSSAGFNEPGLDANAGGGATPPDTTGAIGPSNYVELVNSEIAVYARGNLATPINQLDESSFLGAPSEQTCDGQIQWDQQGQRWLYAALDCAAARGGQALFFGWSRTANPADLTAANWCRYTIATGSSQEDFPKLGHDDSQIIIGTNSFPNDGSGGYAGSHIFIFDKPASGDTSCRAASAVTATEDIENADFTPVPANIADSSATGYVVSTMDPSHLTLYQVGRDGSGQNRVLGSTPVTVPQFEQPANVPQPGTSYTLDPSDTRLTQAVAATDPATGSEGIWTQHTVAGAGGGPSVVRWYELTPGAGAPRQTGTIGGPNGTFAFNGAISPSTDGRSAVVFYNSGDGANLVDLRAQARSTDTPLGQTVGDLQLSISAAADVDFTCPGGPCRWGDYAGASPDPTTPSLVWGTGELTTTAADGYGTPQWGSRNVAIGAPPPPPPPPAAALSSATAVGRTAATLNGTVSPQGNATTYRFEYGISFYTASTPAGNAGAGTGAQSVSSTLSGLRPGTTYHYRLDATSAFGTTETADRTFTTAVPPSVRISSPASGRRYLAGDSVRTTFSCAQAVSCVDSNGSWRSPGTLNTATAGRHTYTVTARSADGLRVTASISYTVTPRVAVLGARATPRRGIATLTLQCDWKATCSGALSLTVRVTPRVLRRIDGRARATSAMTTVLLARAGYTVPSGRRRSIALRLNHAGRMLLAGGAELVVLATATSRNAGPTSQTITLAP